MQLYLKLQCKCLLFDASPTSQVSGWVGVVSLLSSCHTLCFLQEGTECAAIQEASHEVEGSSGEESGGEDVWATMETVGDERQKCECVCVHVRTHVHACVRACVCVVAHTRVSLCDYSSLYYSKFLYL